MAIERNLRTDRWAYSQDRRDRDDWGDRDDWSRRPGRTLTRAQAQALRDREPAVSPWRVIALQSAVGAVAALLAVLVTRRQDIAWSVLYGAGVVVIPGALMARGMTSQLSSITPAASAASVLVWESVKVIFTIAMLVVANRVVQPLVWPALLAGLVLSIKMYAVALLWRGRRTKSN